MRRALAVIALVLVACGGAPRTMSTSATYVTASVTLTCDRSGCAVAPAIEVTREVAP